MAKSILLPAPWSLMTNEQVRTLPKEDVRVLLKSIKTPLLDVWRQNVLTKLTSELFVLLMSPGAVLHQIAPGPDQFSPDDEDFLVGAGLLAVSEAIDARMPIP